MRIHHDTHQSLYREPFGAVKTTTNVRLRLNIQLENVSNVFLCWKYDGGEDNRIVMEREEERSDCGSYVISFDAPKEPNIVWYYFIVEHSEGAIYYGNNEQGLGGIGKEYDEVPPSYQLTVYGDKYLPPSWFKGKIMYQIFVDRFYNGNRSGEVTNPKKDSLLHSHWDNDPLYIRGEQGEILKWDFFGGNLLGVKKKLPYLSELGIDVIYLNPIFQSPSNHKYDTGDYHKIDEMFGDEQIFQELCTEAGELGMTIILDGVFSHTGSDSKYFNKDGNYTSVGAYQSKESPYFSWYRFLKHPDEYECWWGIDTMPNIDELDPSFLEYFMHGDHSVINYWHQFGIAGWRLDVADELPGEFIKLLKKQLRRINADTVLIGEVWEDASNKISYGERRSYLLGEELDSVTNYIFRDTVISFLLSKINAHDVHFKLTSLYENYPFPHFQSMMNIVGTHDTPRILSEMQRELPNDTEGNKKSLERMKLVTLWQMLFPGVPCIYYGDEAGLTGMEEPLNRRTYPWGNENQILLDWYKKIIGIRRDYKVFQTGEWSSLAFGDHVYGFSLVNETHSAIVLLNRSEYIQDIELKEVDVPYLELLTNRQLSPVNEEVLLSLNPLQGVVLFQSQ